MHTPYTYIIVYITHIRTKCNCCTPWASSKDLMMPTISGASWPGHRGPSFSRGYNFTVRIYQGVQTIDTYRHIQSNYRSPMIFHVSIISSSPICFRFEMPTNPQPNHPCSWISHHKFLVEPFNASEKYQSLGMIISNIWKNKSHVPNHQPDPQIIHRSSIDYPYIIHRLSKYYPQIIQTTNQSSIGRFWGNPRGHPGATSAQRLGDLLFQRAALQLQRLRAAVLHLAPPRFGVRGWLNLASGVNPPGSYMMRNNW